MMMIFSISKLILVIIGREKLQKSPPSSLSCCTSHRLLQSHEKTLDEEDVRESRNSINWKLQALHIFTSFSSDIDSVRALHITQMRLNSIVSARTHKSDLEKNIEYEFHRRFFSLRWPIKLVRVNIECLTRAAHVWLCDKTTTRQKSVWIIPDN